MSGDSFFETRVSYIALAKAKWGGFLIHELGGLGFVALCRGEFLLSLILSLTPSLSLLIFIFIFLIEELIFYSGSSVWFAVFLGAWVLFNSITFILPFLLFPRFCSLGVTNITHELPQRVFLTSYFLL